MEDFHLIEKLQQVTVSALVQALHVADPAALIGPGWAAWLLGPYVDAHPQHVAYACALHSPHCLCNSLIEWHSSQWHLRKLQLWS